MAKNINDGIDAAFEDADADADADPAPVAAAVPVAVLPPAVGNIVTHPTFGRGRILTIDGDKWTVDFDDAAVGRKKLVSRVLTLLR